MGGRAVVFDDEDFDALDEEGLDEYEKDDFIVDDEEDDPGEDGDRDEERHKKKRKKKKEFQLDEDDLFLIDEANNRLAGDAVNENKFKRLKKVQGDSEAGHSGFSVENEFTGSERGRTGGEEQFLSSLFDDDGALMDDIPDGNDDQLEEEDVGMADEDNMADFIVEDDELDEMGPPKGRQSVKRKKYGEATLSGIQDAHEIFGDVEDLLSQRRESRESGRKYDETGERNVEDVFEPSMLIKKYMTETDDQMRENDIPERIQLCERITGPPSIDVGSIKAEATWIRKQLESAVVPTLVKMPLLEEQEIEELEGHIKNFLNFTHVQKLDLPFIAMYRKEDISSLLMDPGTSDDVCLDKASLKRHKVLWAVQELDTKWLLLQKRKSTLFEHYNKRFEEESRRIHVERRLSLNRQHFMSVLDMLDQAESEREVDDVDMKFNLHFPPGEAGIYEGKSKMSKRKSHYGVCNKAGLWEVASKLGCSSEQFGLQISLVATRVDEPEDQEETPEEVASNFTCTVFDSPQNVLKGARHMTAIEISWEPLVKKHFRSIYFDKAVVSTCPTPEGNKAIDSFHEFASVKWLRNKPLIKFEDAQWLLIQKAEEEKLLKVTVKLPEETFTKLITNSREKYLSSGVSKSSQLWNEQRKLILEEAISNILLPSLEKEARLLLSSRSKNHLLMEYGKQLWDKVSVAPYKRNGSEIRSDDEVAPRVMICCWSPGRPPTTFVMLDSFGEIVDILEAGSISLKSQSVTDQQRKKHDQQSLLRFMTEHQPEVVVLGAASVACTWLKDGIYEIVFKMIEENPRDVGHDMDGLSVLYGDESLPRIYENSHISSEQMPGQRGIIKRAVALGRYLQNPLAMVAALCGHEKEVLSWKLNPLDSFLNGDEKYRMVEQIMVDVANQVGLDLNLAVNHEWLFGPLQFISGLGPRKATSLQRSLGRAGAIVTRKDLLTSHGLGRKVFISAAGFLRIRRSGLVVSSNHFVAVLDDTRIHPESYGLAQEMAKDIYKAIIGDDNLEDDEFEMTIETLRDRPSAVNSFSIDEYAKDTGRISKVETLHAIKMELIQGFRDWRKPYEELNQAEEFYLISGETDDSLSEGRIVQATVRRVLPQRAICSMGSGLTGMLTGEDYSDDCGDSDLTEKLHVGDVLSCKIKSIAKDRYQVILTCKEQDMRNNRHQNVETLDPYYHEDRSSLQSEHEKTVKEKELAKKHFNSRMIVHPRFQNITVDEALTLLADKDPGESIIRPSSRGPSFLTLTLKIHDSVYAHKDIVEGGKDHTDITSLLRIGKTLKIGVDTFEGLDEVMDRYVDPLVRHLKAMLSYRKFQTGTKVEIDETLRSRKLDNPTMIVYCFSISHEHPGTFILTYIRSSNPHHEYIGLYPKGFKFRKMMFEDVDSLVSYFQKHINDPLVSMVPIGGGWSGSGGWQGSSDGGRTGGRGRGRGRGRGQGRGSHNDGDRDGGGSRGCYKCGEEGHMSRECPSGGGGGSRGCYKCGEEGHMAMECPGGGGSRSCYKCGEGHMARECPGGGSGGEGYSGGGGGGGGSSWGDKNNGAGGGSWGAKDGGGVGSSWGDKNNGAGGGSCGAKDGGGVGSWSDKNSGGGDAGGSSWGGKNNGAGGGSWGAKDGGGVGSWGDKNSGGDDAGGSSWGDKNNGARGGSWGAKDGGGVGSWGDKNSCGGGGGGSSWGDTNSGGDGGGSCWGDKKNGAGGGSWGVKDSGGGVGSWGDKNGDGGGSKWSSDNKEGTNSWGNSAGAKMGNPGGWGSSGGGNTSGGGGWGSKGNSGDGGGSWGGRGKASGSGGSGGCYKCGEVGHMARECPSGGGGSRGCHKCGEEGHMARECPSGAGSRGCFKCGEEGHMARECPSGGGGASRGCYKCGEEGHMARECLGGGGGGDGGGYNGRGGSSWGDKNTVAGGDSWGAKDSGGGDSSWGDKISGGGGGTGSWGGDKNNGEGGIGSWGDKNSAGGGGSGSWGGVKSKEVGTEESGGWGGSGNASGGDVGNSGWGSSSKSSSQVLSAGGSSGGGSTWGDKNSGAGGAAGSKGWDEKNIGNASGGEVGYTAFGSSSKSSSQGWSGGGAGSGDGGGWGDKSSGSGSLGGSGKASNDGGGNGGVWGDKNTSDGGAGGSWGRGGKKTDSGGVGDSGGWGGSGKEGGCDGGGWGEKNSGTGGAGGSEGWGGSGKILGGGGYSGGGGSGKCYKCGEEGHMSRECPSGGSRAGGGSRECYKCGEGHMARECPTGGGSRACYKCGEEGHIARECPSGGGGGSCGCFKCGEEGHMARECPSGGGGCYKCGEQGHIARECPSTA